MAEFRFEWQDSETKNNCLMHASFIHEHDAWMAALGKCGWAARTTLRTTDMKGRTIRNWWEASGGLNVLSHPRNKESDRAYYIKNFWHGE